MRVTFDSIDRVKPSIIFTALLFFFSACISAEPPSEALLMPKAPKSLLLDIDRHSNKIVTVGERGHVLVSNDMGNTWEQSPAPVSQMLTAVDFINERQGWAVGHDGHVIQTSDGGKTWRLQRDGIKAQSELNVVALHEAKERLKALKVKIAIGASDDQIAEGVTPLNSEPVVEFDEYGNEITPLTLEEQLEEAKWEVENAETKLNGVIVPSPLMDVWFADDKNGWASGAFGTFIQTTDGGETWVDRSKDIGNKGSFHLNAVIGLSKTNIIVAGEAGFVAYSHDGGETWQKAEFDYDGTVFGLMASQDSSMVVATGLRGNTLKSLDAGVTWETIYPGIDYSLSNGSLFGDEGLVLVGTGGSIAVSYDKGNSFQQYTLPARASLSNVVVLEDNKLLLVGQGGIHHFTVDEVENVDTASVK